MWVFVVFLYLTFAWNAYRRAQRQGAWSWSEFVFIILFLILEGCILSMPVIYIDSRSRWFAPAITGAVLLFTGNFVWLVLICRRWPLPNSRVRLQPAPDAQTQAPNAQNR